MGALPSAPPEILSVSSFSALHWWSSTVGPVAPPGNEPALPKCPDSLPVPFPLVQTGRTDAGMSISPLWASRPRGVIGPKPAQSLSYLLLLSGGNSKAGRSIPKVPVDPWWAPGAGQEAGKGGGGGEGTAQLKCQDQQCRAVGPDLLPVPALPKGMQIIKPLYQPQQPRRVWKSAEVRQRPAGGEESWKEKSSQKHRGEEKLLICPDTGGGCSERCSVLRRSLLSHHRIEDSCFQKRPRRGKVENSVSILLVGDWDLQPGGSSYLKGQAGGEVEHGFPQKETGKGLGNPSLHPLAH